MPSVSVIASDTILATIGIGEVYEFRNSSDRQMRIDFSGNLNFRGDYLTYAANGSTTNLRGRARRMPESRHSAQIPPGGKILIEHRYGGSLTVRGNADFVEARRLITPIFHVVVLGVGDTFEFHNNSIGSRAVSWMPVGYPNNVRGRLVSIRQNRIFADGRTSNPYTNSVASGVIVEAGDGIILTGLITVAGISIPAEISFDITAFGESPYQITGSPYRITACGQRSFPPGTEQNLSPITDNAAENDVQQEAERMLDMLGRIGYYHRPFSGFIRAHQLSFGRTSSNNLQLAYYQALYAMLQNERNTFNVHFDNATSLITGQIPGVTPIRTWIRFTNESRNAGITSDMEQAIQDVNLLLKLRNNTNVRDLQIAIDALILDLYGNELTSMVNAADRALESLGGQLGKELLKLALSEFKTVISIVDFTIQLNRFNAEPADRIMAMQHIREAVWSAYGEIIENGRRYGFSESDLEVAYNLFNLSQYLALEQSLWAAPMLDGSITVGNITRHMFNRPLRFDMDAWLLDDISHLSFNPYRGSYPQFRDFNQATRSIVTDNAFYRFNSDGTFIRRTGWGVGSSITEEGVFSIIGDILFIDGGGRFRVSPEGDVLFCLSNTGDNYMLRTGPPFQ